MYELKTLLPQFDIKLPTCMYPLKNVSLAADSLASGSSTSASTSASTSSCVSLFAGPVRSWSGRKDSESATYVYNATSIPFPHV